MNRSRKRIYRVSITEEEGERSCTVEVRTPHGGAVSVVVSEEVSEALDELQRELWSSNRREDRHTCSLEDVSSSRMPPRAFPKSPEQLLMDKMDRLELESAISQLPDVQRRRFLLKNVQGLTAREIARIEGCTEQAVGRSLALARKNLQEILSSEV